MLTVHRCDGCGCGCGHCGCGCCGHVVDGPTLWLWFEVDELAERT